MNPATLIPVLEELLAPLAVKALKAGVPLVLDALAGHLAGRADGVLTDVLAAALFVHDTIVEPCNDTHIHTHDPCLAFYCADAFMAERARRKGVRDDA